MEEYEEGGHSVCRNPILQKMFVFLGIGERGGSGADFIAKGWRDNGWSQMPTLQERVQPDRVEVTMLIPNVGNEGDVVKDVVKGLSERQRTIINMIALDATLSAKAISERISEASDPKTMITERTVQSDLATLQKQGILSREGGRKEGQWVIKTLSKIGLCPFDDFNALEGMPNCAQEARTSVNGC